MSDESRRVLILIGHTGSGHLRTAEAIREALDRRYENAVTVEIVDALGDYAPFPFNHLAGVYPGWINRAACTWRWGYWLTDGRRRATAVLRLFWPRVRPRALCLLQRHMADVVVSVHPLTNHYVAWALCHLRRATPTLTLVTDPVSVHAFWLSPDMDCCLVGTAEARRKALACGIPRAKVRVTGLPVNPRFADELMGKEKARHALGWSLDCPAVLALGGGEGMGDLYETVRAIDATCSGIQMAVIAGHNRRLRKRLETESWRLPLHVYGFVEHAAGDCVSGPTMPRLMSAADILITKAGPGSLHEAFLAGLPLMLSGAVPGQEEGNVRMVVEAGAGVWVPRPEEAAALLGRWIDADSGVLVHMAARSRALARPDAAGDVADEVWRLALTNL